MAEATDRHLGDDELVYVATTAPTVPASIADVAYKIVGLQAGFTYSSQGTSTEIRDKRGVSLSYGPNTRSGTLAVNTSLVADDGQTILDNAAESSPKTDVWVLITSGVTGQRFRHFKAKVGGMADASPSNAAATKEYTLGISGAPTKGTVSA